tara:strand:- start:4583 stop:5818 length:1236 start_codon:yes stop_codon:yes gene_type:complete
MGEGINPNMKMQCAVAVSLEAETRAAMVDLCEKAAESLSGTSADLALLFFSNHHAEHIADVVPYLRNRLNPQVLLGCSCHGIIGGAKEIETTPGMCLWLAHLPRTHLVPFHLTFERKSDRVTVAGWPKEMPGYDRSSDSPTTILFADPYSTPATELFTFLSNRFPGAPAVGGMVSSGHAPGKNRLLFNDHVVTSGTVGVTMMGAVKICTVVSQGCRPIGERFIITKAKGNMIHELGGSSALDRLQELFEGLNQHDQQQARTKTMVGYAMDEYKQELGRGDFLIRGLVGVDRPSGSISLGDVVKEGQTVQFHLRDEKTASEDLNLLLAGVKGQLSGIEVNGALLFSCTGRGQRFFGRPHHDVSSLRERIGDVPVGGFFAAGEIGLVGSMNFLHGYAASVALFCQAPDIPSNL